MLKSSINQSQCTLSVLVGEHSMDGDSILTTSPAEAQGQARPHVPRNTKEQYVLANKVDQPHFQSTYLPTLLSPIKSPKPNHATSFLSSSSAAVLFPLMITSPSAPILAFALNFLAALTG